MRDSLFGFATRYRKVLLGLAPAICYIAWAYPYIMESSVVATDGKRYFNLFDDAMISMRYAWNFSHGQGLVWNPGERVEGYTNLLLTLIMSIFTWLLDKSHAVLAVQILGVVLVLGCVYLAWKLAGLVAVELDDRIRPLFKATVLLLVLTYYPLSFWSLTGMETGVLTVLILGAVIFAEKYRADRRVGQLELAAVLLGLAYLTRPDSVIFAVPILAYTLEAVPGGRQEGAASRRRSGWTIALLAVTVYLLFPLGQEAFRIQYYGAYLPNTYYLKLTGMPLAVRLRNGLGFLEPYVATHGFFLLVAGLALALKPDRRKAYYLVLIVAPILYQIWTGGDPARLWRIMAPAQPLAAILFALGAIELLQRLGAAASSVRGTRLFSLLTAIGILSINLLFVPQVLYLETWFPRDFYTIRDNAAVALNEITTQDASVGVLAAGVVPYYTGRTAFDFLGRTDAYIASLPADISGAVSWNGMNSVPGHNKYDLAYSIQKLQPTYIDTSWWGGQDLTAWVAAHYDTVTYKGSQLCLKRDAPEVKWELIEP